MTDAALPPTVAAVGTVIYYGGFCITNDEFSINDDEFCINK